MNINKKIIQKIYSKNLKKINDKNTTKEDRYTLIQINKKIIDLL